MWFLRSKYLPLPWYYHLMNAHIQITKTLLLHQPLNKIASFQELLFDFDFYYFFSSFYTSLSPSKIYGQGKLIVFMGCGFTSGGQELRSEPRSQAPPIFSVLDHERRRKLGGAWERGQWSSVRRNITTPVHRVSSITQCRKIKQLLKAKSPLYSCLIARLPSDMRVQYVQFGSQTLPRGRGKSGEGRV